jgi:hypothetical protein
MARAGVAEAHPVAPFFGLITASSFAIVMTFGLFVIWLALLAVRRIRVL